MAAAPTLITDARRQVVDFTIPFMTTQATLLLRRPPPGTELRVKDLADLVAQSEIKYGTLRYGDLRQAPSSESKIWRTWWHSPRSSTVLCATATSVRHRAQSQRSGRLGGTVRDQVRYSALRRPPPGTELRVKDLADLVAQSEIKYGTLRKGFIPRNFRSTNDTLLTIVWRNMRRLVTAAVPQGSHVQVLNVPENPEFFILF